MAFISRLSREAGALHDDTEHRHSKRQRLLPQTKLCTIFWDLKNKKMILVKAGRRLKRCSWKVWKSKPCNQDFGNTQQGQSLSAERHKPKTMFTRHQPNSVQFSENLTRNSQTSFNFPILSYFSLWQQLTIIFLWIILLIIFMIKLFVHWPLNVVKY